MNLLIFQVFEDLTAYMKSLYTLVALKPNKLYPGHGPVIQNAVQRLEMYISNRNICDKRIMEALKSHTKPLSSNEIVEIAYGVKSFFDSTFLEQA